MKTNWTDIVERAIEAEGREILAHRNAKPNDAWYATKRGLLSRKEKQSDGSYNLYVAVDPDNVPEPPARPGRPSSKNEDGTVNEAIFAPDVQLRLAWLRNASDDELREGPPAWLTTQEKAHRIHGTSPDIQTIVDKLNDSSDEDLRKSTDKIAEQISRGTL